MTKRTQTGNRVTRKHAGRKRSAKVAVMPLVVKNSPEDTQGVIRAAVDESTGRANAVIPVAVKRKNVVRKRAAVIPVEVRTLQQPKSMRKRVARRPETTNPLSLRSAAIGIADDFIEAERNFFRLGFHYMRAMVATLTNTVLGRTMARFEREIQATQLGEASELAERDDLLRVA